MSSLQIQIWLKGVAIADSAFLQVLASQGHPENAQEFACIMSAMRDLLSLTS